jgi:putative transcriptional regulator
VKKHDADALIPEYVLGTLPEDQADEIDAIVGASPELQRRVSDIQEGLAGSIAALPQLAPSSATRSRLLEALAGPDRFRPFFDVLTRLVDLPVDGLRAILARIDEAGGWEAGPLPTVQVVHFKGGPRVQALDTGLLRMAAGTRFPHHRHLGDEITVVLEGTLRDGARVYGPGQVIEWRVGTEHDYAAGPGRDLVTLVVHSGIEPA